MAQTTKDKRILIVNVNWLGDVLFSTPFIRALRKANRGAYIACMVVPRCKEMLEGNPYLNELIVFDEKGEHKGVFGKMRFVSLLRSKQFDEAYILHRSLTRTLITALSKIPVRVGFYNVKRGFLLSHKVSVPKGTVHRAESYLSLAKYMGIEPDGKHFDFFIGDGDRVYVKELLRSEGIKENDFIVVMNPGGNWDKKRWPVENFSKLADELIKRYGVKLIITGTKKDSELAESIKKNVAGHVVTACGDTTLKQLGALFEKAYLVLTGDTGPLHIATSVKAKVIAIFGPTSKEVTGPFEDDSYIVLQKEVGCKIPCYILDCKHVKCMKAITVNDVLKKIDELKIFKKGN